nr:MAG TPA: major capsid protein [Bacteriophage sp.]
MPLTLEQAKKLSQDKLTDYVIDEFRKSALLDRLPFDNTVKPQGGTTLAYVYNRVTTLPTAAPRAINTEYTPQETATTPYTVNLKVFGGSFQLDRVIIEDERQVVDHVQFQLAQKIQATRALFHDMFINGDSGTQANQFDGIDKAIAGSSTEIIPSAAIDLSSSANIDTNWKVFLDTLRKMRSKLSASPTLYLMNTDMFAVFQSVMDRAGINLASKENYGDEVMQWGGSLVMALGDKPGTSNPIIATDASTNEGETSIYAVNLALDGVHGVSPSGSAIVNQYLPDMTAPGAVKTGEVEMVAAVAVKATRAAGVLRKVKIA